MQIAVVGAGLSGATIARLFAEDGYSVSVIDKRNTLGGNAYDFVDKDGIRVQPYGPHIFHTNFKEVFDFLSRFTAWEKYEHKVKAKINGKLVPVPFNLTSLKETYPADAAERITLSLIKEYGEGNKVPILKLKENPDYEIRQFADFVYRNVFYTYTLKQWGFPPEKLGEEVMNRVPVYVSEEDRYFTDEYQFMPKDGFTDMVKNMLTHKNIRLNLGQDATEMFSLSDGKIYLDGCEFDGILIYTGCLDELFGYKYGVLPYRSLRFKFKKLRRASFQPAAVVNYTTNKKYTRISEFTKFTCEPTEKTVIVKEYPKAFKGGKDIPYYPIPVKENRKHYDCYKREVEDYPNLYPLGRLANYKYVNMDVAVKNAMELYESFKKEK